MTQARGITSQVKIDQESSFGNAPSAGSRRVKNIPFFSCDLARTRTLNSSEIIRGDRNPASPFRGNVEVSGGLTVPLDSVILGYWMKYVLGNPTTTESLGSEKSAGTETCTIADGVLTLNAAIDDIAVGDKIEYDSTKTCYVKEVNSTTEVVVVDAYGQDTIDDEVTDVDIDSVKKANYSHVFKVGATDVLDSFTLEKIFEDVYKYTRYKGCKINSANLNFPASTDEELQLEMDILGSERVASEDVSTGGTVTIASGEATFSVSQTDASAGDKIYYGNSKEAFLISGSGTTWDVATERGGSEDPDDVTDAEVHAILTDADYGGGGADPDIDFVLNKFEAGHAALKLGGNTSTSFKNISLSLSNNLDGDQYVIGSGGIRKDIPEGMFGISGSFEALFEDLDIVEIAEDDTETSFQIVLTKDDDNVLTIDLPEVKIQENDPPISGPAGVSLSMDFQAYYSDNSDESSIKITLENQHPSYDY